MASKDRASKQEEHESKRDREQAMRGMAPQSGEVEEGQFLASVPGSADSRYFRHKDSVGDGSARTRRAHRTKRTPSATVSANTKAPTALGPHNDDIVNEASAIRTPPAIRPPGSRAADSPARATGCHGT